MFHRKPSQAAFMYGLRTRKRHLCRICALAVVRFGIPPGLGLHVSVLDCFSSVCFQSVSEIPSYCTLCGAENLGAFVRCCGCGEKSIHVDFSSLTLAVDFAGMLLGLPFSFCRSSVTLICSLPSYCRLHWRWTCGTVDSYSTQNLAS